MRSIAADLTTAQKKLYAKPAWALVIGATTLTSYLISYDYGEALDRSQSITLTFNNASGYFNSSAPAIGSAVELKRGIGTDLAELPRFWVEDVSYTYAGGRALCVIRCIDWWGKLAASAPTADQVYAATSATTILEWILTQAGLTRLTGSMTAPTLTFTARKTETHLIALMRLIQKIPERLYAGLDAEIKWKTIPSSEASVYTFGWNDTNHRLIHVNGGSAAWKFNDVTVYNANCTGNAANAAQKTLVGTRAVTYYDATLASNAACASAAATYLNTYTARATQATLTCRPCHGLELLDVVKIDNPPWGGSDITGRVITYREYRTTDTWRQQISLGKK